MNPILLTLENDAFGEVDIGSSEVHQMKKLKIANYISTETQDFLFSLPFFSADDVLLISISCIPACGLDFVVFLNLNRQLILIILIKCSCWMRKKSEEGTFFLFVLICLAMMSTMRREALYL